MEWMMNSLQTMMRYRKNDEKMLRKYIEDETHINGNREHEFSTVGEERE